MPGQHIHTSSRSLITVALIAALLVLGFCPLRNCLTAWLAHSEHVTRTNGAHLLTADDCQLQSSLQSPALQTHGLMPPMDIALCTLVLFGIGVMRLLGLTCLSTNESVASPVPIYLRHRVWRI